MKRIHVPAPSRAYDVLVGRGLIERAGELCRDVLPGRRAAVVTDTNVGPIYAKALEKSLEAAGFATVRHVIRSGEASKDGENFLKLLEFLAAGELTRADAVFALGGGVVGDLSGFAASAYLRGIRLVQVPTSLLSQVDSSVGGKTAIDLRAGKNLAGAFYEPDLVLCDIDTLSTLPKETFRDGMAEVIKYGVIADEALFCALETDALALSDLIARCVSIKRDIVCLDERDLGVRQLLNFGHTPAHAIEKLSGYAVPHGRAVAAGMAIMARAAARLTFCAPDCPARIAGLLCKYGLPSETTFSAQALSSAAGADKKRSGDTIQLVVPEKIGSCRLWKVRVEEVEGVFQKGLAAEGGQA